jgi:hypothetical protein
MIRIAVVAIDEILQTGNYGVSASIRLVISPTKTEAIGEPSEMDNLRSNGSTQLFGCGPGGSG